MFSKMKALGKQLEEIIKSHKNDVSKLILH